MRVGGFAHLWWRRRLWKRLDEWNWPGRTQEAADEWKFQNKRYWAFGVARFAKRKLRRRLPNRIWQLNLPEREQEGAFEDDPCNWCSENSKTYWTELLVWLNLHTENRCEIFNKQSGVWNRPGRAQRGIFAVGGIKLSYVFSIPSLWNDCWLKICQR